jgi:hypothetical protein
MSSSFRSGGFGGRTQEIPWVCVVEEGKTTVYNLNLVQGTVPLITGRLTLDGKPPKAWTASLQEVNDMHISINEDKVSLDVEGRFVLQGKRRGTHQILLSGTVGEGAELRIRNQLHLDAGETPWSLDITTGRLILENLPEPDPAALFLCYKWEGSRDLMAITIIPKDGGDPLTLTVPAGCGSMVKFLLNPTAPEGYTEVPLKEVEVPAGKTVTLKLDP